MSTAIENLKAAQERATAGRPQVGGFPYLAEVLRQAGVRRYHCTVPAAASLYLTDAGPVAVQGPPILDGMAEVARWDREAVIAAIRTDQAGRSSYAEFSRACWAAGVVRYEVDLTARTCTYYGAAGEHYVESYPLVDVR